MAFARSAARAHWLLGVLPLLQSFVACSGSEPAPTPATGGFSSGGANSGGVTTGGISTGGSTGGMTTGGSTGGATGGSTGGGISTGGSTGGVTTGGSTGGATSGGSSNTGGLGPTGGSSTTGGNPGTGGSATTGGSGGNSGTGGSASTGGGPTAGSSGAGGQQPGAALNGASWTMKCTKPDTDPGAAPDLCWLLPMGQNTCPAAGYTSLDQTLNFGGTPGTTYQVTIHFEGTHEAGDYTGGTAITKEFLKGATHNSGGLHTWLSMEVSAPAATYNPNAGGNGGSIQVYNYRATIPIEGGATIRMKAYDKDCLMHHYCQDGNTANCKGYVLEGISPATSPIDGSFLRMTVESAKAM